MQKADHITCDMTIMLPSSARRMSLRRSLQARKKPTRIRHIWVLPTHRSQR